MELKLQIISLVFSFVYGIVFSICTNLNYRFLFSRNIIFKIFFTFVFILDFALLYFLLIMKINQGIVHNYFLLSIGFGFILTFIVFNERLNIFKKKVKNILKKCKLDKNKF